MNKLGIVILTKNNFSVLEDCISSIIETVHTVPYTVYVCDTGSNTRTVRQTINFLQDNLSRDTCKLIQLDNYHFASNYNNIISEYAHEQHILMCNDDIILHENCVDKMYQFISQKDNIGTVGCKLIFADGTIQHAGQHVYIDEYNMLQCTHHGYRTNQNYTSREVVGNTAACCLVKRQVFVENNGFDELYTECWEDIQFNMRLKLSGYKNWYICDAVATHLESVTRTKSEAAKYRLRYDYTYKLKPWFDSLSHQHQQHILKSA